MSQSKSLDLARTLVTELETNPPPAKIETHLAMTVWLMTKTINASLELRRDKRAHQGYIDHLTIGEYPNVVELKHLYGTFEDALQSWEAFAGMILTACDDARRASVVVTEQSDNGAASLVVTEQPS